MTKIFLHFVMEHLLMGCIATDPLFQSALTQYTLVGKGEKKEEEGAQFLVEGSGTGALPLTHLGILMVLVYWVTRKAGSLEWGLYQWNARRPSNGPPSHPFAGPHLSTFALVLHVSTISQITSWNLEQENSVIGQLC